MSGFYGKVLYQYTRLFDTVNITPYNTEKDALAVPEDNDAITLAAGKAWDTLYFGPANHWIQLNTAEAKDAANNNIEIITIGHSLPNDETSDNISCVSIKPEDVEDEDIINIKNGDYFLVNQKFDNAGHLNTTDLTYYRMPITTINIGKDPEDATLDLDIIPKADTDKLYFNGDNTWISLTKEGEGALHFNHTKLNILPQLKNVSPEDDTIALDNWIVSYDNGASWNEIKDEEGDVYPTKTTIKVGETEVEKAIPKPWTALNFEQTDSLYSRYSYYPTAISMPAYNSNSIITAESFKEEIESYPERYDQSIQDYVNALEDDIKIYSLHQGDIIEAQQIIKDQLGHTLYVEPIYLQLPYSDSDKSIETAEGDILKLKNRLDGKVQNADNTQTDKYDPYETNLNTLSRVQQFLDHGFNEVLYTPARLIYLTGSLKSIYQATKNKDPDDPDSELELVHKDQTIASTIGLMDTDDGLIAKVNDFCDTNKSFYSISSALQAILTTQTKKNESIDAEFKSQNVINGVVDDLQSDVDDLQSKAMPHLIKLLDLIKTEAIIDPDVYQNKLKALKDVYMK